MTRISIKVVPQAFSRKKKLKYQSLVTKGQKWLLRCSFWPNPSSFIFSLSILLSTKRNNTLIWRGILGRKNTLNVDFVTGIQINRASASIVTVNQKVFQNTFNELTTFTSARIIFLRTKNQQKCIHQQMLQFSFSWVWLLIFNIPVHQNDREDALL